MINIYKKLSNYWLVGATAGLVLGLISTRAIAKIQGCLRGPDCAIGGSRNIIEGVGISFSSGIYIIAGACLVGAILGIIYGKFKR